MAASARRAEMGQVSSHHNLLRLHNDALLRNPSIGSITTAPPSCSGGPLSPFLNRAAPEPVSTPSRAYFSPSRDSFMSKPSVSELSHIHSSPSPSPSRSRSRSRSSIASDPRPSPARPQHHSHASNRQSRHSSGQRPHPHRPSRDVEHSPALRSPTAGPRHGRGVLSDHTTVAYDEDGGMDESERLEGRAVTLLLYLSFPVALLSFITACWTLVCLALFLLAQPLRLLHARPSPASELTSIISPSLRLQLRLVHSSATSDRYSASMLVLIHLISPFVSIGVASAAWVAACFWFFSAILGDPAGGDGHNDGKAAVVAVRNWWEAWLCRGLRR